MKRQSWLALMLILALAAMAALPALGEELPVALEDGFDAPEWLPELPSDALPELDGEWLLDDALEALPPAENVIVEENSSVPQPDYEPQSYKLVFGEKKTIRESLNAEDIMGVYLAKGKIKSWQCADKKTVELVAGKDGSMIVRAMQPGKVVIVIIAQDGARYILDLVVENPYELKGLSLNDDTVTVKTGLDIDLAKYIVKQPAYAEAEFIYTSSNEKVVRVNADGIVTGVKKGEATVTIASKNGLKTRMKLKVTANRTDILHAKPKASDVKKLGETWSLWPRRMEMNGNGSITCTLWLLNGASDKLGALLNLDLAVYAPDAFGDTLIARAVFDSTQVRCGADRWAEVDLTFPLESVFCPADQFTGLGAKDLRFRLYSAPVATCYGAVRLVDYKATEIPSEKAPSKNPVKYRALLVSESDFYWDDKPGNPKSWEHINRNRGDVKLMSSMLKAVKTPDGGSYKVTTKDNTTALELRQLIRNTFKGADKNDVSLFFIATHGVSDDESPDNLTGAVVMYSPDETYPTAVTLGALRDMLLEVPGKVIVMLGSCGSGAAVYRSNGAAKSADQEAGDFTDAVVAAFRDADPGVEECVVPNTGELRRVNKFYVLTAAANREESWGTEYKNPEANSHNFFTQCVKKGVGKSNDQPADRFCAGNKNGTVDLHELYRYISVVGDEHPFYSKGKRYYQHVQVYPQNLRYPLFR